MTLEHLGTTHHRECLTHVLNALKFAQVTLDNRHVLLDQVASHADQLLKKSDRLLVYLLIYESYKHEFGDAKGDNFGGDKRVQNLKSKMEHNLKGVDDQGIVDQVRGVLHELQGNGRGDKPTGIAIDPATSKDNPPTPQEQMQMLTEQGVASDAEHSLPQRQAMLQSEALTRLVASFDLSDEDNPFN